MLATSRPARRALILVAALLGLIALLPLSPSAAQPAATFAVYLPMVASSTSGAAPTPAPAPAEGGLFPLGDPGVRTTSSAIALDAAGGTHIAFVVYGPAGEPLPAYYGYCAPGQNCARPSGWQLAVVGQAAEQVQLQLTPAGKPRIIYRTVLNSGGLLHDYYYAECDSGCASSAGWRGVRIGGTSRVDADDWELPQRSFALDRLGRPRFVYSTGGLGDPNKGAFYLSCDRGCTRAASWQRGTISLGSTSGGEIFSDLALTFTSQNQPRLLANIVADREGIYYMACDEGCADPAGWRRVFLADRGFGPLAAWDIELDGADRPRAAIYIEGFEDGGGDLLAYLWCDAGCADSADSWFGGPIGLPKGEGETPDLELDAQGRPRIAYHSPGAASLGYLWCDIACESDDAAWSYDILEQNAALDAQHPLALPPACEAGAWTSGYQPTLALDSQGRPRIASEAKRLLRCLVRDPQDPGRPAERTVVAYRHARVLIAARP